jgi:predicted AlkP superfamily pyrophosphatase or phosphodiesterase
MNGRSFRSAALLFLLLFLLPAAPLSAGSAYDGNPRLVVIVVVDQGRADLLERYRDRFLPNGFRLFLDRGAYFSECYYDYATTRTSPGHATLLTGTYVNGHGILSNLWWDPMRKRRVLSVEDQSARVVGIPNAPAGSGPTPHYLRATTLGDALKLATGGRSRVFTVSLKSTAAVLSAGRSADGVYFMESGQGRFLTSSFYRDELPGWAAKFNADRRMEKYWNREWKDASGKVLGTTAQREGARFYNVVALTPFANDYQLEFTRELVTNEKLGKGAATDLLVLSISATDTLGHQTGPDDERAAAMMLELDRQLADFFAFLGKEIGLAHIWMALTADHGVSPHPEFASKLRLEGVNLNSDEIRARLNAELGTRYARAGDYVPFMGEWPIIHLSHEAFGAVNVSEEDAGKVVGDLLVKYGYLQAYYSSAQLADGDVGPTELGRRYANSYTPAAGWYLLGVSPPFSIGFRTGTDHSTGLAYDTHVPLGFYGAPFQPGTYRGRVQPVDLVSTLASLLGINPPSHAIGRVLTEALAKEPAR